MKSSVTKEEIKEMLCLSQQKFEEIRIKAVEKRNKNLGNNAYIRASLEIGNGCMNKCKYCGMSSDNKELYRYKMSGEEIKECIDQIAEYGIKQLHMVSGESKDPIDDIIECIKYAKKKGLEVTTVLGKREKSVYRELYDAGASRYIMKFETSNSDVYEKAKPDDLLQDRLLNIEKLKEIGFKVGTVTIIGLPETTMNDVVNDLLLLKKINPNMASSSAFSPNRQSVYSNELAGSKELTLRFISLMRLILRDDIYIPSSSSLGFHGQIDALNHGANVISVHFTPEKYSNQFSMYKSKNRIKRQMDEILEIVESANMKIGEYV